MDLDDVLGKKVRDKITGFTGIAQSYDVWRTGCRRIGIFPTELDKDGKAKEMRWVDEMDIEILSKETKKRGSLRGGPQEANIGNK